MQGNIYESKTRTKFCKKLFMKAYLLAEFNREKYDLNCKCHTYKIKTVT